MQFSPVEIILELLLAIFIQVTPIDSLNADKNIVFADQNANRIIISFTPYETEGSINFSYFEGERMVTERVIYVVKGKDGRWNLDYMGAVEQKPMKFPQGAKEQAFWTKGEKVLDLLPWDKEYSRPTDVKKTGNVYSLLGIPFKVNFELKEKMLQKFTLNLGNEGEYTFAIEK